MQLNRNADPSAAATSLSLGSWQTPPPVPARRLAILARPFAFLGGHTHTASSSSSTSVAAACYRFLAAGVYYAPPSEQRIRRCDPSFTIPSGPVFAPSPRFADDRNIMTKIALSLAIASALLASQVSAQNGPDPRATTDLNRNQPTKSWTQWQPKATYALNELPDQYMGSNRIESGEGGQPGGEPQSGYNTCARNTWNQDSRCQTAWINSLDDFCLWGPAEYGTVGEKERSGVAYCTTDKHGTRLIPDGTIEGAHFVRTRDYVQVTGVGDFTSILIPDGDDGGEFDPHGADDLGNPIGGILYTTANPASNGEPWFVSEWTNFMSYNQFCLRACWGQRAAAQCEHIYDVMGCRWNIPANYDAGVFESCDGDIAMLQGIYGSSTFRQGDAATPSAHPAPASSQCSTARTISHGLLAVSQAQSSSSSSSAEPTSSAASASAQAGSTSTMSRVQSAATSPVSAGNTGSSTGNSGSSTPQNNAASGAASLAIPVALTGLAAIAAAALAL